MSEYWVSKKKYFCKYCEIYIADDVPSRQQHENGLRHQGNRERFIRNIYKTSEKKKKDLEEEKRELARVDQAAHAAFAQDVSAGYARPGITSAPAAGIPSTSRKPLAKPSNPFTNYTTAESLGYTDPDAEKEAAEVERRRTQGVVGEWQVVAPPPPPPPPIPSVEEGHVELLATSSHIPLKREAEVHSDEEYDRHSKLRKRTVRAGLGEIYDPGIIPIKVKKKEESTEGLKVEERGVAASSVEDEQPKTTGPPRWIKVQWKRPEEPSERSLDGKETGQRSQDEAKKEEVTSAVFAEQPVKVESEGMNTNVEALRPEVEMSSQPASGSMFRKRRMPASATANKGRRHF